MTAEPYLGKIEVSPQAIASIAAQAILECYGVVGVAAKHPRDDLAEILPGSNLRRGVDVRLVDGQVQVDLHVVIEYGTRVSEVAQGIKNQVRFKIEHATGLTVGEVNVHVEGLHVSAE